MQDNKPLPKIDRQREHQANERTYLAWLRTAVALMSFGLVISRFGLFVREMSLVAKPALKPLGHSLLNSQSIGVTLVILGIFALVLSLWRYNQAFQQIEQGDYQPTQSWAWVFTALMVGLGAAIVVFLLTE